MKSVKIFATLALAVFIFSGCGGGEKKNITSVQKKMLELKEQNKELNNKDLMKLAAEMWNKDKETPVTIE